MDYWGAFRSALSKLRWWERALLVVSDVLGIPVLTLARDVVKLDVSTQRYLWLAITVVTVIYVYRVGRAAWEERQRTVEGLEAKLACKLAIVFGSEYPSCLHEDTLSIGETVEVVKRLFRVGIVNLSGGQSIDDVQVHLLAIEGLVHAHRTDFLPEWLRPMGTQELSPQPFTVNPGRTPVYIDVVEKANTKDAEMRIQYWSTRRPQALPTDNEYRFTITAKGRDIPEVEQAFHAYVDRQGVLQFQAETSVL